MADCERCKELEAAIEQLKVDMEYVMKQSSKIVTERDAEIERLKKQLWKYEGGREQLRF